MRPCIEGQTVLGRFERIRNLFFHDGKRALDLIIVGKGTVAVNNFFSRLRHRLRPRFS